ncbi:MAG: ribosome-associated translation inhibitor RaiA [Proteobacteria bacterium]|nr:ribosome-associated translation inhibitor RaiA [Pseudomonadota bacterium]
MEVTVTFRHLASTDALRSYAQEKVMRIKKYVSVTAEVAVVLSLEKHRHLAEITLNTDGATINAREVTEDMYAAIDLAVDKIERQVKKHKEKVKNHKPGGAYQDRTARHNVIASDTSENRQRARVVKTESIFIKPMSLDEAVMQIDLIDNDFLVFTNADTQKVSVLYRRRDGNYGLIEPENV